MIYYAVYYSTMGSGRVKNYAGEDKVDYICRVINELGIDVTILSNAKTSEKAFANSEFLHLFDRTNLIYFSSFPRYGVILHAFDVLWGYMQLIYFIISHVKKDDTVLVYHSLGYRGLWGFLRSIKRFNYVLEVEELFQTIEASVSSYKKNEMKVFEYPDAFLFSSSILEEEINHGKKPFAIVNGVYKYNGFVQQHMNNSGKKVVYAGSLEKQKGVDYVISSAEFLSKDYEVHIIGFGSEKDIHRIEGLISKVMGKGAIVTYDGVFKGKEYFQFLQSCDVGVCIQDENDEFNKYEYPSKVFSYLSNGLQVVANELIQLKMSTVFPYLHIAKSKQPKDVAAAIIACSSHPIRPSIILDKLNEDFKKQIKPLLRR